MSVNSRLDKLEAAFRPPAPDPALEARFRRALERVAARLGLSLPEGPCAVVRGGDPAERLRAAERRLLVQAHQRQGGIIA